MDYTHLFNYHQYANQSNDNFWYKSDQPSSNQIHLTLKFSQVKISKVFHSQNCNSSFF